MVEVLREGENTRSDVEIVPGRVIISSAAELEEQHGDAIRHQSRGSLRSGRGLLASGPPPRAGRRCHPGPRPRSWSSARSLAPRHGRQNRRLCPPVPATLGGRRPPPRCTVQRLCGPRNVQRYRPGRKRRRPWPWRLGRFRPTRGRLCSTGPHPRRGRLRPRGRYSLSRRALRRSCGSRARGHRAATGMPRPREPPRRSHRLSRIQRRRSALPRRAPLAQGQWSCGLACL